MGQFALDILTGTNKVLGIVVMLFNAGSDGKDIGVKNNIFRRKADLFSEDLVSTTANFNLTLTGISLSDLNSLNMLHSQGFLAEVFSILARHNISVDLITTSEVSVALTFDTTGSTSTGESLLTSALLTELSALCRVEVEENLALVAIIGNNLSKACGVGKEVFGVLEPFNIRMICYGASSYNLCFLVPGDNAEQVVQELHRNLFEK